MEQSRSTGLNEAMQENSMLSEHDPSELKAYDLISRTLADLLEPGEGVVAYADRDLHGNEVDVMAYQSEPPVRQPEIPDVMGYTPGGPRDETDAFAYDEDAGRAEPDVMGYEPGGPRNETDAFAYDRPPETADNDAFMSAREPAPADVDFLVLTDTRLIRGFLEGGKIMVADTLMEEPQVQVIAERYVAVRMPPGLCGIREGDWWCWPVPAGADAHVAAKRWTK
jgi:hypothetical protein